MAKPNDPLDINARLYKQIGKLLDDMERADRDELMTMPQRVSALIAVGRIQKMFQDLRKGDLTYGAGSAVRKYASAFAPTYAAGGGGEDPGYPGGFDRAEPGDPDYTGDDA